MPVLQEFKKFILRGNVVDLAVGVVIGTAFTKIVDSLVADLFMPIVGVLTGGIDVSQMRFKLYGDAYLGWGKFAQSVLNFVIIGFCMFMVVKGINALHKYVLRDEAAAPPPEPTATEKLLTEIRDLLKEQKTKNG
ncbi:large conductance mechanosensitive channel protein : Large-conductance mechanosensitive channel OS=Prevotella nigrescens ATCC 33563 GN=mscL PE=3 SV=1: MscL [Gemmataceae bacterium]|nr:large conductance mechanosensitive channel protein : Large-conductance mechanosensitive channel OS=Prevotella nigrescens ATCC 33563 GN=mscL PE=3 SV=1: MscL [Gemmataceae bacterium]VTT96929.1 large conductance mechanosensitive channel protein : Large-conductance mechanosensitive channel OS=Prevotella nigrescens ATCC 33563 GN=mscL PE=3 SV=1: MscL [Gemmataceae bacterium]